MKPINTKIYPRLLKELDKISKEYGYLISSISNRMIQDRELARDVAQEVWYEIIKSYPGFRGDSKISTWIYTIAKRVIMRFAKNERLYTTRFLKKYFHEEGQKDIFKIQYIPEFEKKLWVKEQCDKCLTGVLHCLTNEYRMIYIFREIANLSYKEISKIMKKDEQTLRKIVSRTKSKLNRFLKNECVLYNPEGSCQCKMKKLVKKINLIEEYDKIRKSVEKINFYKASQRVFPEKNYWKNIM
ncbi:MAG: RNA polymerase sigma factor [Candidatus Aminicenantia bacterium]